MPISLPGKQISTLEMMKQGQMPVSMHSPRLRPEHSLAQQDLSMRFGYWSLNKHPVRKIIAYYLLISMSTVYIGKKKTCKNTFEIETQHGSIHYDSAAISMFM